jgi:hypothetical protein
MAHFAELDENNIVIRVIVVNNELLDENGVEKEQKGIEFCQSLFGGNWVQTSYNGGFRARFAGVGFLYDSNYDVFISPKPFESWLFSETIFDWIPPIEYPLDGNLYTWDESIKEWVLSDFSNSLSDFSDSL